LGLSDNILTGFITGTYQKKSLPKLVICWFNTSKKESISGFFEFVILGITRTLR
jgi:hypothetical protein